MTSKILMIRPVNFAFNEQTADSNAFQQRQQQAEAQQKALQEFDAFVAVLRQNGIEVLVFDDTPAPHTPDSIFPNNWISFHHGGEVFLYPMQARNRRQERKLFDMIKTALQPQKITDLSYFEQQNRFLEGTGSMVLDRVNKITYACISPRTDVEVLAEFCQISGYRAVIFHAADATEKAIYHTNVLMCMGDTFCVICLDSIRNAEEKKEVKEALQQTGKQIILISFDQMNAFAGNMLQLQNREGENLLVMSTSAFTSLKEAQLNVLQQHCRIVYSSLQTIESNGGGSARCMMAEVF